MLRFILAIAVAVSMLAGCMTYYQSFKPYGTPAGRMSQLRYQAKMLAYDIDLLYGWGELPPNVKDVAPYLRKVSNGGAIDVPWMKNLCTQVKKWHNGRNWASALLDSRLERRLQRRQSDAAQRLGQTCHNINTIIDKDVSQ